MDKEARNDFMECKPAEILENIQHYLNYCANDVSVTHRVYAAVLPEFLESCLHRCPFSGMLTMGSSFLPVNEGGRNIWRMRSGTYRNLEEGVKTRLVNLAMEARNAMENEKWKDDVWLRQLDWTPKVAGKSRGIGTSEVWVSFCVFLSCVDWCQRLRTRRRRFLRGITNYYASALFGARVLNRILPLLLKLSFDGHCPRYTSAERWHLMIDGQVVRPPAPGTSKVLSLLGKSNGLSMLQSGHMTTDHSDLALVP